MGPMQETKKIRITLNGEARDIAAGSTVFEMLQQLGIDSGRVAVELNRAIVRKTEWAETKVPEGAQVEIVEFVGGGRTGLGARQRGC
jgi:sulfur carrier protein